MASKPKSLVPSVIIPEDLSLVLARPILSNPFSSSLLLRLILPLDEIQILQEQNSVTLAGSTSFSCNLTTLPPHSPKLVPYPSLL